MNLLSCEQSEPQQLYITLEDFIASQSPEMQYAVNIELQRLRRNDKRFHRKWKKQNYDRRRSRKS